MTAAGVASPGDRPTPKPLLALAGSLAMPGLGQLYLGDPCAGRCSWRRPRSRSPVAARLGLAAPPRLLWS